MVEPFFTMLWHENIPRLEQEGVCVSVVSGGLDGTNPVHVPPCPPNSWAAQPGSNVTIMTIKLMPGAAWVLPASPPELNRSLFFFAGTSLVLGGRRITERCKIVVDSAATVELENPGEDEVEILLLEGRPIGEPVVQHGPFVMNSRDQIM